MLTEIECVESLGYIWDLAIDEVDRRRIPYEDLQKSVKAIQKLIEEHFDNQPLKFEELEEKMWVWYKPLKEWKKIYRINPFRECFQLIEFNDGYLVQFKENIFYRKQVE